jgi:hypothetical protein
MSRQQVVQLGIRLHTLRRFIIESARTVLSLEQGDQIGRIFVYWVIVYFGQFVENYRSSPNIWTTFIHGKSCAIISTKLGWATFWATFSQKFIWSPWFGACCATKCFIRALSQQSQI